MDKSEERDLLRQVFGSNAAEAYDFEGPDFLIAALGGTRLGVEVTSFYSNNADAKLRKLPGYTVGLIEQRRQVHRSDRDALKVEEAVIHDKDGAFKARVMCIMQEQPGPKQSIEILCDKINEKERKSPAYLRHCQSVDLIVYDGSNLFFHDSAEDFHRPFLTLAPLSSLIQTPFREIHLVTKSKENKTLIIPLVANIFFADCFAFEHFLTPMVEAKRPAPEVAQLLAACLFKQGYQRVKVSTQDGQLGFFCGAWEMHYSNKKKNLRDWMLHHDTYNGVPLGEVVEDIPGSLLSEADALVAKRKTLYAAVDIRLPAHGSGAATPQTHG